MNINQNIDYTLVNPTTVADDIKELCAVAIENKFAAVSIPPPFVKICKSLLGDTPVKVSTVIGFPFGYSAVEAKLAEIFLSMVDGADELEVVVNFMAIKNNDWFYLANELNHILPVIKKQEKIIKAGIEASVLTDDEIKKCCDLYGAAAIDYLSTSTGFGNDIVSVRKIEMMRAYLPDHVQIKTTGKIETLSYANELVGAGAARLGCERLLV